MDACAVGVSGAGIGLACQSYKTYESLCAAAGVQGLTTIVDRCGVCFGDGSSCLSSLGTCSAFGDGNFLTFDNKLALFEGSCDYVLAKDCLQDDFDVQIRMAPCGTGKCIVRIGIRTPGGQEIDIDTSGRMLVDGLLMSSPVTLVDNTRISPVFNSVSIQILSIEVEIMWYFDGKVEVSIPSWYSSRTCGLCGNFNHNPLDDFYLNSPVIVDVVWVYGTSWKVGAYTDIINGVNASCADSSSPPTCNSSSLSTAQLLLCQPLMNSFNVYGTCFSVVDPTTFYQACINSVCDMLTQPPLVQSQMACEVILQYESLCVDNNVTIGTIVDSCGVVNGDGSSCIGSLRSCSLVNNGLIVTFSNQTYLFSGTCDYLAASFSSGFSVYVRRSSESMNAQFLVKSPRVSQSLLFNADGSLLIDNQAMVVNSVVLSASLSINRGIDGSLFLFDRLTGFGVKLSTDLFVVFSPQLVSSTSTGLCSSVSLPDQQALSPSYFTPSRSCSGPAPPPPSPPLSCLNSDAARDACFPLDSASTNSSCFSAVDPSAFLQQCLALFCSGGNTCGVIKSYELTCSQTGTNFMSWVDECGVCNGDGTTCSPVYNYAVCTGTGDPHFTSFDGSRYDFQGNCDFIFSTVWSGPSTNITTGNQTLVAYPPPIPSSIPRFEVQTRQEPCGSSVTCTTGMAIRVGSITLEFGASVADTSVNGLLVSRFPYRFDGGVLTVLGSTRRVSLFHSQVIVQFVGYSVMIKVTDLFRGYMGGLCGQFPTLNSSTSHLWQGRTGGSPITTVSNGALYPALLSWYVPSGESIFRTPRSNCNLNILPTQPCLSVAASTQAAIVRTCSVISDPFGPYSSCHAFVDPSFAASSCAYDGCANANSPASMICDAVKEYERACIASGGNGFQSVVDVCGVCFGDGSSCMPSRKQCSMSGWKNPSLKL